MRKIRLSASYSTMYVRMLGEFTLSDSSAARPSASLNALRELILWLSLSRQPKEASWSVTVLNPSTKL